MLIGYLIVCYLIAGFASANALTILSRKDSHCRFYFEVETGLDFFFALLGWPVIFITPCIIGICSLPVWLFDKWVKLLRS
jgi:hypothetical protein